MCFDTEQAFVRSELERLQEAEQAQTAAQPPPAANAAQRPRLQSGLTVKTLGELPPCTV